MDKKTSAETLLAIKNHLRQRSSYESQSVEELRQGMEEAANRLPRQEDIRIREASIGALGGEWIIPDLSGDIPSDQVILYFHGGGFVAGSCATYRDLVSRIATAAGIPALIVAYRLAPEHPYPAANEDCLFAYRWLLANGYDAGRIVLGGDSVGASLALMTLLSLRDGGEPLPAGAFLISPHTDLVHLDGASYESRSALDPTGSREGSGRILRDYLGPRYREAADLPLLSPLRMNLDRLPPLFLQVGDQEVLLSDAERFADRAREAGVQVELEVWEDLWSVFHYLAYMLPEARSAIANLGAFARSRLGERDLERSRP
ncbi:alpha/beta hydrolase [Cohnella nanjingensis]|uniref:Alpha/beta hydrolase n=1 Tax=Cohnella nanjingensis TaxID=1387779 RepID=A0A7X0VGF8_9BACL|nr:alpha/beta hydrolase [Cohnella nanjingensis]MBB6673075.1 alpha/beta hydrolase [Cohnella nanjingensis]